ncbi:S8 family peptidase [Gorillibacterium massiliense]|uniref:S8 family peptidase n=1 Tax=Gorillibacterium massiliense TaxID=1280390 RepID=UPI0004AD3563|nr:S8 family peptidase [Gorillibacterium massiliense]
MKASRRIQTWMIVVFGLIFAVTLTSCMKQKSELPKIQSQPSASAAPLSPLKELEMKKQTMNADIQKTNELCRSQCTVDFRTEASRLSVLPDSRILGQLNAYRLKHPHAETMVWSRSATSAKDIRSGRLDSDLQQKLVSQLVQAKKKAFANQEYRSPSINHNGKTYFVLGVPLPKNQGALLGVIHQDVLKNVESRETRDLRIVPYPNPNRKGMKTADAGDLKELHPDTGEENEGLSHYHKNQVVVKFKTPPSSQQLTQIRSDISATAVQKLGYTYVFTTDKMDPKALIKYFAKHNVEYAEPHYFYMTNEAPMTPNDQLYSRYQWNLPKINTENGWTQSKGSSDVIVAVVDTGVDLNHPDLQGRLVKGYNVFDQSSSAKDDVGHGTHVAGVIAATVNNSLGIAGMTWNNPIMPVKVLDSSGSGNTYNVAQGIIWAADHGAKVINLSLGNYASSSFLQDAIRYAFDKDIVLIAAAGNDNTDKPGYPAAYDEVFAVAATDEGNKKASFSNYGDYIDVAAPGVSIASTYPDNQYAALSGTSMASPHVSALAALIRSANPALKNTEVMDIMRKSANDLGNPGKDNQFGYGEINVSQALNLSVQNIASAAEPNAAAPSTLPPAAGRWKNPWNYLLDLFR